MAESGAVGHQVVESFVEAARGGDLHRLHALIDWAASGVASFVAGLRDLPEDRRAELAREGMSEMRSAAVGSNGVYPLGTVMVRLSDNPRARELDNAEVELLVERMRPPQTPPGVPADVARDIEQLRQRINAIRSGWRVTYHRDEELYVGLLPDTNKLALHRPLR